MSWGQELRRFFRPALLIVKLSRFDYSKRQADEAEARTAKQRMELSALQTEVESLTKRKDVLAPTVADWEKRLKEMHDAQATADSLNAKQRQTESDITQASKRLEDANRAILEADKQKTELSSTVERLKSELVTLTKTNTDAKLLERLATEAERRLTNATNALANLDVRRRQLEADASSAQMRFEQIQKESDDLRQAREKSNNELAALRQQIQMQKDQLSMFDPKAAELKALQTTAQQVEQKLAKSQQQVATLEARASEMDTRYGKVASEFAQLTNRLEQARSQTADWETKRDTYQQAGIKATQELAAAQKLLAETQASQNQLGREQAKLVAQVNINPLVVLAGVSGTGKSALPMAYAEASFVASGKCSVVPMASRGLHRRPSTISRRSTPSMPGSVSQSAILKIPRDSGGCWKRLRTSNPSREAHPSWQCPSSCISGILVCSSLWTTAWFGVLFWTTRGCGTGLRR
jgi:chromosome segregation ATPase